MSAFEEEIRRIVEEAPRLSVGTAVAVADARVSGDPDPIPNPTDTVALAMWANGLPSVIDNMPDRPINAIKELRAAGWECGVKIGLREAKWAIDVMRGQYA